MRNIDKNKLKLVHSKDDLIKDIPLETKEIGFYRDSWIRFRKNRASFVAFIIICIILLFIIIGPHLKDYTLYDTDKNEAKRFSYLTPRIPVLENFGIFDGTNNIEVGKRYLTYLYHSDFEENVILSGMPELLTEVPQGYTPYEFALNLNSYLENLKIEREAQGDLEGAKEVENLIKMSKIPVKVDWYKYTNFKISYMPEEYFGVLDRNAKEPDANKHENPLAAVTRTVNQTQFNELLRRNVIIDILQVVRTQDPNDPSVYYTDFKVRINVFLYALDQQPADTYFWFGTTGLGADLFTQLWTGARISLMMAVAVTLINAVIGLTIGAIVGYYGGILDLLFDRLVEIISALPFLVILTLLILRFGSELWIIVIAFTATGWITSYGVGRFQFYRFKNREYVLAARTLGASDGRIMFKHIFPNMLGYIVTMYALAIPTFVFTEASFSFLGIIQYSNAVSVGMLIQRGQSIMQIFPHLLFFPAIYIAVLMIAFNLFGNGLRDAFNPSLRGVE